MILEIPIHNHILYAKVKEKTMANKKILLGMLATVPVFGLALVKCNVGHRGEGSKCSIVRTVIFNKSGTMNAFVKVVNSVTNGNSFSYTIRKIFYRFLTTTPLLGFAV